MKSSITINNTVVVAHGIITNHAGQKRNVVQIDDDGTIWYRLPGTAGEHYDTAAEWYLWATGSEL